MSTLPSNLHNQGLFISWFLFFTVVVSNVVSLHIKDFGYNRRINLEPGKDVIIRNFIGYFMYNITNPDEYEMGSIPMFEEIGPYVYRETRRKFDVEKVSDSKLKYKLKKYWEFMPELSEGHKETDLFNVINIPMLILANKLSAKNLPTAFNNILVDELLEKGDTFIRRNEEFGNVIYHGMNVSVYTEILEEILQGQVPIEYANGRFALYKKGNDTIEGEYLIQTKGPNAGNIISFNNQTKLEYWSGDYCNKIDGTDGYSFRPGVTEEAKLKIFYPELCRSVTLENIGKSEFNEIPVEKFTFPMDMLEDPRVNEKNLCFCSKPIKPTNDSLSTCLKKGFIDYASCKQDSPLVVSYPHFLYADEEYLNQTIGLNPDSEEHKTEFLVEPKTGTLVSAVRRFQFNVKLRPLDNVDYFKNVTNMIFPVFWTYRKLEVNESTINDLKEELKKLADNDMKFDDYSNDEPSHDHHDHHDHHEASVLDSNKIGKRVGGPNPVEEPQTDTEHSNTKHSKSSSGSSLPKSSVPIINTILLSWISVLMFSV